MSKYRLITFAVLLACLVCLLAFPRPALHAQETPTAIAGCAAQSFDKYGGWVITNNCDGYIAVYYTSSGDISGEVVLRPRETQNTGFDSRAVARVGKVSLYVCPAQYTAEQPDGSPLGNHYSGREYKCVR